jgi:putative ABC transport system substrate-binding protein
LYRPVEGHQHAEAAMISRRAFTCGIALSSAGFSHGVFAQRRVKVQAQPPRKMYRIATVHPSHPIAVLSETGGLVHFRAFFEELRRLGYEEGQNLVVDRYSGDGRTERYAELAKAVVRSAPDLIFPFSAHMVQHFKEAAGTVPIVAYTVDPVAFGFATSLARPGGNITGVDPGAGVELWNKLLELLREVVPTASRVGFLTPRAVWDGKVGAAMRAAAQLAGISLLGHLLTDPIEEAAYRSVFATATGRVDALIVGDEPENYTHRRLIVELAERSRLPTVYPNRLFAEAGGLLTYGIDHADMLRYAASQIDRVLKGAKPGEIPFYQATKFELVINLRTARALGIEMPAAILARADEVIE